MRVFVTRNALSILVTAEECDTPDWVAERFLPGVDVGYSWWAEYANNKRFYAEVTDEERDRLVLCCAWAGDNIFSQRHDGHYSRSGGFGPSMHDVLVREAKLMWRTADRLAALSA